jgi:hypothetical protein
VSVRVQNTSIRPWRLKRGTNAGVHASGILFDPWGRCSGKWRAGLFDAEVAPGESIDLTLALPSLPPGRYRLLVDMEDEEHCAFFQVGSEPLDMEFEVRGQETSPGDRPGVAGWSGLADRLDPGR